MADSAPARTQHRQQDEILEAVAFAAERFLRASDWLEAAQDVLARLGAAAGAGRAYVVRADRDERGAVQGSTWVAEWCAPGFAPLLHDSVTVSAPWFPRWRDLLAAGEAVQGDVGGFPDEERAVLSSHGVASVLALPVVVHDRWWGSIGLDDERSDRGWHGPALDALRTAAQLLSASIERQQHDERLRDAEERYRKLVERIPAVTYTDVPDDGVVRMGFVSPQIQDVLGYPPQAFVDDPGLWKRLIHPDDRTHLDAIDAFDINDTAPFDHEYRMLAADGREVWVHDTSLPMFGEDGRIEYFQGFMLDITERRLAEARLRAAEERFRVLVEQMPAVTYSQRIQTGTVGATFDYVSPQVTTMLGLDPGEVIGTVDPWGHLVHPDDAAAAYEAVRISDQTGEPTSVDYRVVRPDGVMVWIHEEAVLIRDEGGRPTHWQGFLLDITERMTAAEQIRLAEERYRNLVEHTPAITYQETTTTDPYDPTSSIAYVSPQIESILGYTPEQWSQPGFWATVIHPDDLPAVIDVGGQTVAGAEPYRQDYRMIAADGRVVWFHDEAHPISGDAGEVIFWQGVMTDITERKEAEDRLRRAQARLQALMENVPAVVYTQAVGGEQEEFWISPQSETIFGYTFEEWSETEDFWEEHLHPDDREGVLAVDAATDASLAPFSYEYRFRRADGTYAWVLDEAIFVPNVTEDGRGFWQGLLFDVTERKESEHQLMEAERVFRATVEHLPAIVYRESPEQDRSKLYLSPQVEAVTGWTREEWADTPGFWVDHLHPDDRASVLEANEHADRTHQLFAVDYRFLRKDGEWIWLHDEATFVGEGDDEGFWQGFMFDVTDRKRAEQHLRETEEKFRTIVEQNQAIFYIQEIDPQNPAVSLTTYIAPGNTDLIGYTEEEIEEDPGLWRRTVHPDDRERVFAADAESNIGGGDRFSMEYRMIHKDGRIVWVQDEARLVRIGDAPPYWQGFLLDITERKKAEEQLAHALEVEREATSRLRRLDEMKNTFLQAVSHDLRTPLAAILGLAITLERSDVDLDEKEAHQLAGRIAENARRLDRLVTNLLDLDRLARGIVAPRLRPTEIGELVRSVIDGSDLIPHDRLRTNIDPVTIPADGAKVERIVENLLANTARHTPERATIWVTVRPQDDGALIAIEDDGPGVAADLRGTIFEPFQQGPDAPQHSPGVGVGLTLVRRFAELHGGRAWVEDRRGGGASFRVFLPRRPVPTPEAVAEEEAAAED